MELAHQDHRVGVLRRRRTLKCERKIDLPEGPPGLGPDMEPVGEEDSSANGRRKVDLIAEVESTGVGGGIAGHGQPQRCPYERGEPVPAFATGDVELERYVGK